MVIKFTFPCSLKKTLEFNKRLIALPPLPMYITRKGPYTNNAVDETERSIVLLFEFHESKLAEACRIIFKQMEEFYGIPGFSFSTQVWSETREALRSIGLA
jgi:hypothetical protein